MAVQSPHQAEDLLAEATVTPVTLVTYVTPASLTSTVTLSYQDRRICISTASTPTESAPPTMPGDNSAVATPILEAALAHLAKSLSKRRRSGKPCGRMLRQSTALMSRLPFLVAPAPTIPRYHPRSPSGFSFGVSIRATPMFAAPVIAHRLVDAQDKALKQEVLRHAGQPLTRKLDRWIDTYMPLRCSSGTRPSSYFERRCTELNTKKARTDAFLALRAKALQSCKKKWPRIWDSREKENQKLVNKARVLADADLAMKKEWEARREWEAADARVAVLMRHRTAGKLRTGFGAQIVSSGCFFDVAVPNIVHVLLALLKTFLACSPDTRSVMSRSRFFPPELCLEVASHTSTSTLAQLLCSASNFSLAKRLLYSHISVSDRAYGLVKTLASQADLASMVKSLEFRGSLCAHIDDAQWALVLPALHNLRHLEITHHIPLDAHVLPHISFRLHSFTSTCAVFGPWLKFVSLKSELRQVAFRGDVLGPVPDTTLLPMLRQVTTLPADLAKSSEYHLTHVWIWLHPHHGPRILYTRDLMRLSSSPARLISLRVNAAQILMLLHSAPLILGALQHLILEEDRSWAYFDDEHSQSEGALPAAVSELDTRTPHLATLTLRLAAVCNAPLLRTFHFCGVDSCATWHDWGQASQILAEMLAPVPHPACSGCGIVPAEYHCGECANVQCGSCIKLGHTEHPLHQMKKWNGTHFQHATLKVLGVVLQLGHGVGGHCTSPSVQQHFRIIGINGLQEVALQFCGCHQAKSHRQQQLDAHLAPAGVIGPRVALTFEMDLRRPTPTSFTTRMPAHLETQPRRAPSPDPARRRHHSVPLATEVWKAREEDTNPTFEIGWDAMASELAAWAKTQTAPASKTAAPAKTATHVASVDGQAHERVWYEMMWQDDHQRRLHDPTPHHKMPAGTRQDFLSDSWGPPPARVTDGENPENGWALWMDAPPMEAEALVERDQQWQNVRCLIMDRMPEPHRHDMLLDEYRQELLDEQDARARVAREEASVVDWSALAGEYID
ncbi:hypothetical protein C8R44DRAFT_751891 [Mycena epipterygia]|nr:hypothetical protein C8R44DRAFT_751891 [Mycena epipterygia]